MRAAIVLRRGIRAASPRTRIRFSISAAPDVDGAYRQLKEAGLVIDPPVVAPYGMKQLSFSDPDGYVICLQWRV